MKALALAWIHLVLQAPVHGYFGHPVIGTDDLSTIISLRAELKPTRTGHFLFQVRPIVIGSVISLLTLSQPQAIIIGVCKQHSSRSHVDLRCLTFSLSTLHINVFPNDSVLK